MNSLMSKRLLRTIGLTLLLLPMLVLPALALPPSPAVPPALQPWLPWVLEAHRDLQCAGLGAGRACDWPGLLAVAIDDQGGRFQLDVWLDSAEATALPGDRHAWPLDVTIDGEPAPIQASTADLPRLQLTPGHHQITGRFAWVSAPEVLAVPDEIGVVELTLRGQKVEAPRRNADGRLFLQKEAGKESAETDTLTVSVARLLQDGVPLRETTRLMLRIAGRPRDLVLGRVLLAGARPIGVSSPLPVQVGQDGAVRVHGQPGQYTVDIEAVHGQPESKLDVTKLQGDFFEQQEVWVWKPAETVRSVELAGLQPVDPARTQLTPDWQKAGRCYLAAPGQTLDLKEMRRGEAEQPPNRIDLQREMWLDLDGRGMTTHDRLTGEMFQGWRLDAGAGMELGRVADSKGEAFLITLDPATGKPGAKRPGVELRDGKLDLEADARIPDSRAALRVVGWDADVHSLQATLHLPPGWRLLGATGIDQMPETWLDSWTLLDLFFVLMVALGAGRLLGWPWGVVALLGLALCHGEDDAPQWLWLNALAALALWRVVPAGWFRRLVGVYHVGSIALLLMVLVPFATGQVRLGMYPQVDRGGQAPLSTAAGYRDRTETLEKAMDSAPQAPAAAELEEEKAMKANEVQAEAPAPAQDDGLAGKREMGRGLAQALGSVASVNDSYQTQRKLKQIDTNAVVQTGPGVPRWRWTDVQLRWSGPVQRDHQASLWLLSPRMHLLVSLLRTLMVVLLGLRLLDRGRLRSWLKRLQGVPVTTLLLLLLLPSVARAAEPPADLPTPTLLEELEKRLLAAQDCQGPCVVASELSLRVTGQEAVLTAEVSAQRDAGWALPGPDDVLLVREVRLDDQPTRQLRRMAGGLVLVRVPAGRHVVTVRAVLPRRAVLTLQLDPQAPPHHVTFASQDWTLEGVDPNGVTEGSLQLSRRSQDLPRAVTPGDRDADATELPPWFQVERHLQLGLPWQVHTVIRREHADRAQLVKIPLLQGESVITEGVRVEAAEGADAGLKVALVQFPREALEMAFDGELPITPAVALRAPVGVPWTESWRLSCSPIWRCSWQGPAPVATRHGSELQPVWLPWPAEQVRVEVVRPEGAPGQAVTVDRVDYRVTPGQRLLQAVLTLHVRTSQGGWRTLTLPEGAEVQSVALQGTARPIRPQGRSLRVPLEPGEQTVEVKWQQPWERAAQEQVPALRLGGPAANVLVTQELGENRWLLWTHGPSWGPAVLLWSHLLLVLLGAALLGRLQGLPLRTWQWALLGLGMVQLPAPALLLVVGWFLAMAWRRSHGLHGKPLHPAWHDLTQLVLAAWTLAFLSTLYAAIHTDLLGGVDMQVSGAGSSEHRLTWYVDRTIDALPDAGSFSLPLLVWRTLMLMWALWLVAALLRWLPWAWRALALGGLWHKMPIRPLRVPPPPPPPPRQPVV